MPALAIVSGDNQFVVNGHFASSPLTLRVTVDGVPLPDALVSFIAQGGWLALSPTGAPLNGVVQIRTDASGLASIYFQEPANGTGTIQVLAASGSVQSAPSAFVSAGGTGVPAVPAWALISLVFSLVFAAAALLPMKRRGAVA